jgi:hypothetical protein
MPNPKTPDRVARNRVSNRLVQEFPATAALLGDVEGLGRGSFALVSDEAGMSNHHLARGGGNVAYRVPLGIVIAAVVDTARRNHKTAR